MVNLLETSLLVGLLYSLITIGLSNSFRVINFPDLTLEGSVILGGALSLLSLEMGGGPFISLLVGFLGGCIAGFLTACFFLYFNVSKLLSGIITTAILYSINIRLLDNRSNRSIGDAQTIFSIFNPSNNDLVSILILLFVILAILVLLFALFKTRLGMLLRILGDNELFVISLRQNPKLIMIIGLIISNGIIGLAGALLVQYKRVCDVNMSFGLLVTALASLMLGELFPTKRIGMYFIYSVIGTILYNFIIGIIFFSLGDSSGQLILSSDIKFFTGFLLIILSLITKWRKKGGFQLFNSHW